MTALRRCDAQNTIDSLQPAPKTGPDPTLAIPGFERDSAIAHIRKLDPTFDGKDKSDVYLQERIRIELELARRETGGTPVTSRSADTSSREGGERKEPNRLARAWDALEQENAALGQAGPPPCAAAVRDAERKRPSIDSQQVDASSSGESVLDRAYRRAAEEERNAGKAGPPPCAAAVRDDRFSVRKERPEKPLPVGVSAARMF